MALIRSSIFVLLLIGCKQDRLVPVPKCGHSCTTIESSCKAGVWECLDNNESTAVCVGEVLPEPELCDGLDNNCDGLVDNFTPPKCTTNCGIFTQTCENGQLICHSRFPKDEVCNGIDDDCDGVIDNPELLPLEFCYPGEAADLDAPYGDCHPGRLKCESAVKVCRQYKTPTAEVCDSIDNNCNNTIDENLPNCQTAVDFKVVLTWNHINDVDLHLRNPMVGVNSHMPASWGPTLNSQGDCFYGARNPNWDNQSTLIQDDPVLDQDVIYGTGPETIIIPKPSTVHPYTIGVHMYNYAASPDIVNAKVEIYCGGLLVETITHSFNQFRDMWVVGDITFSNSQCLFTPDGYSFTLN